MTTHVDHLVLRFHVASMALRAGGGRGRRARWATCQGGMRGAAGTVFRSGRENGKVQNGLVFRRASQATTVGVDLAAVEPQVLLGACGARKIR